MIELKLLFLKIVCYAKAIVKSFKKKETRYLGIHEVRDVKKKFFEVFSEFSSFFGVTVL